MYLSATGNDPQSGNPIDYQNTNTVYSAWNTAVAASENTTFIRVWEYGDPDKVNYYSFDPNNIGTTNGVNGGIELLKGNYIGGAGILTYTKPVFGWGMHGNKGAIGNQGSQGNPGATGATGPAGSATAPVQLMNRFSGYRATVPDWNGSFISGKYAVGGLDPNWASPSSANQSFYEMQTAQTDTFDTEDLIDAAFIGNTTPADDLTGGFIRVTGMAYLQEQVSNPTYLGRVRIAIKKFDIVPNTAGPATPTDQPTGTIMDTQTYQIAPNTIPGPFGEYAWSFILDTGTITLTRNEYYKLGFAFEVVDNVGTGITLDSSKPWMIKYRIEYVYN